MNNPLTHSIAILPAAMLFAFSAVSPFPTGAHEGEDHGAPAPAAVSVPSETRLAVSGDGALFDVVLKYRPFAPGETVEVTLYLVSAETNRPIADAAISANLSEGEQSKAIVFTPKPGGPVGAYHATLTPGAAAPMSWLFDVTVGDDVDLIGVTGFQPRPPPDPAVGETRPHAYGPASLQRAAPVAVGVLLLVVAFIAGRMSARKGVSA